MRNIHKYLCILRIDCSYCFFYIVNVSIQNCNCVDCKVSKKHYAALRQDVCVDLASSAADAPAYGIYGICVGKLLIMLSHCVICVTIIDLFMHVGRIVVRDRYQKLCEAHWVHNKFYFYCVESFTFPIGDTK